MGQQPQTRSLGCQVSVTSVGIGQSLFSPVEHVESAFVGSWNEVTYCSPLTVSIGLCLSVQCELALRRQLSPKNVDTWMFYQQEDVKQYKHEYYYRLWSVFI